MTEGEYLVGINFNPGNSSEVDVIKRLAADLIDYIREHGKNSRCTALCITSIEIAAMWGVKSITKPSREG